MTKKEYDHQRYLKKKEQILEQSSLWQKNNKEKSNLSKKIWRSRNLTNARNTRLKYLFGISIEDYDKMLERQNYSCAICQMHYSSFKRNLAVDHCHLTRKVRGLLCFDCNSGIGKLKDSVEVLNKAINYLKGAHNGA